MLEDPNDRIITRTTKTDPGFFTAIRFVNNSHDSFQYWNKMIFPGLYYWIITHLRKMQYKSKTLNQNLRLQYIPAIILCKTSSPKHICECYKHSASSLSSILHLLQNKRSIPFLNTGSQQPKYSSHILHTYTKNPRLSIRVILLLHLSIRDLIRAIRDLIREIRDLSATSVIYPRHQ